MSNPRLTCSLKGSRFCWLYHTILIIRRRISYDVVVVFIVICHSASEVHSRFENHEIRMILARHKHVYDSVVEEEEEEDMHSMKSYNPRIMHELYDDTRYFTLI